VVSPDLLPPTLSFFLSMKTEEADDDREPGDEGISKCNTPPIRYAFQV